MADTTGKTFSWNVLTHVHKERSVDWYWAVGLISIAVIGVSIWLGNILFAIVVAVAVGALGMMLLRGPREHSVRIDAHGISVDGTLYPYRSIVSFWVEKNDDAPRLYLMTTAVFIPHMMLPLESASQADQLRSFLKRIVEEKEQDAHLGENLAEMFGL